MHEKIEALNLIMKHYYDSTDWDFDDNMTEKRCVFKLIFDIMT